MNKFFTWTVLFTCSVPYFSLILKAEVLEDLVTQTLHIDPIPVCVQESSTKTFNPAPLQKLSSEELLVLKESAAQENLLAPEPIPSSKSLLLEEHIIQVEPSYTATLEALSSIKWVVSTDSTPPMLDMEILESDDLQTKESLLVPDSENTELLVLQETTLESPIASEIQEIAAFECSQPDILFFLDQEHDSDSSFLTETSGEKIESPVANPEIYSSSIKNKKDDKQKRNLFANIAIGVASAVVVVISAILGSS